MRFHLKISLLLVVLLSFMVIGAQLTGVVNAGSTNYWDTRASNHSILSTVVTYPAYAYDKNLATYAYFPWTADGWYNLTTWTTPPSPAGTLPTILQVDFKVRFNTSANLNGNDRWRMFFAVAPTLIWTEAGRLWDWTGDYTAAMPLETRVWANKPEPNDGVWSWTDIGNIRIAIQTDRVGGGSETGVFWLWEAWITIYYPDAKMTVRPQSKIDYSLIPATPVTIKPNADGTKTAWTGTYTDWDDPVGAHDGDTTYVSATGTAKSESSHLETSSQTWSIGRVRVVVYARQTDAAADENLILTLVFGTTEHMARIGEGGTYVKYPITTTTYTMYTFDWGTNPSTKLPWAWADITDLQAGVRSEIVGAAWTGEIRVTQLYVEISGPVVEFDIYAEGVIDCWGYSFILTYGTAVLTATTYGYIPQAPYTSFAPSEINDAQGYIALAYTATFGALGASGNRTLVRLFFLVDGTGSTPINLTGPPPTNLPSLSDSVGTAILLDPIQPVLNGYFENGVVVPEFPLGMALELVLIVPMIYIWWKRKAKNKMSKQTVSPILKP